MTDAASPPPPGGATARDERATLRGAWLALAALTLLLGVVYAGVFRGEPVGDDLTFHLAEIRRLADCFRAWDFDLWNTSANAGYASAYYYQVVPLAVPAALAALTDTGVLVWFQLCLFLPLVLGPLASYRGMRLLGARPWAAVSAAAAVAFAISSSKWGHGSDGTFTVGLYTQTWAFAAFPLALGHAVRWAQRGQNAGAAVAWGAFVGMSHPFAGIALGVALVAGLASEAAVTLAQRALAGSAPRLRRALRQLQAPDHLHVEEPVRVDSLALQLVRLTALGAALLVASAATWAPVLVDYAGFGGFPHRVAGEDGTGFSSWCAGTPRAASSTRGACRC